MCRENKDCEEMVEQMHGLNVVARSITCTGQPLRLSRSWAFGGGGAFYPLLDYVGSPMQSMGKSAIDIHS